MPHKVKLYSDNDGLIEYEDSSAAHAAPNFFDGHEIRGSKIKVELAEKKAPPPGFVPPSRGGGGGGGATRGGGGYGGGGGGGGGGSSGRPGDWNCPK